MSLAKTSNLCGAAERVELGATKLSVSRMCLGTAGWVDDRSAESDSVQTAQRFFSGDLNMIDTSNNYGFGQSETRIGRVLGELGGLPEGYVLQTKLDRHPLTNSFSGDRMKRSLEESLGRLGVDHLSVLYLHDPENTTFEDTMSRGGAVETLIGFKEQGIVDHIGIAGAPVPMMIDYVDTGLFDVLITHSRYTVLDRSAEPLIARASAAGIGVLNAAPFGGGLLSEFPFVTQPAGRQEYGYNGVHARTLEAATAIGEMLASHGIPIAAAALQWSMRDSRIHSTIVGALTAAQLDDLMRLSEYEIPEQLWCELVDLAPAPEFWLA